jgi:hypothetical protein
VRRGCNFGVNLLVLTVVVSRASGGMRSVAEPDEVDKGWCRLGSEEHDVVERSNASTSIMALVDIDLDVSTISTSIRICTFVLIDCNDDGMEADAKDDDEGLGTALMKLSELVPSCSSSPGSSLCTPFVRLTLASSLAAAPSRLFRTLALVAASLSKLVARTLRLTPVISSRLDARKPAFSSTRSATVFTRSRKWDESLALKMLRSGVCKGLRVSGSEYRPKRGRELVRESGRVALALLVLAPALCWRDVEENGSDDCHCPRPLSFRAIRHENGHSVLAENLDLRRLPFDIRLLSTGQGICVLCHFTESIGNDCEGVRSSLGSTAEI